MKNKNLLILFAALFLIGIIFWYSKNTNLKESSKIPFEFSKPEEPRFPDRVCDISDYGAIGDGATDSTKSFSASISDCAKSGGGTVTVPAGKWLTGAIHLASNINLHLEKDAEIVFSANPDDYLPVVFTRFEGMELMNYSPFIYASNCENVAITGEGKLNGQGSAWQEWNERQETTVNELYLMAEQEVPVEKRIFGTKKASLRPSFVQFLNCKNILLSGITIIDGPFWTIHPVYSENITIDGISIRSFGHNSDGIDIDSSKNALIKNSKIETGDDGIAIKSGLDKDGWRVNKPSENIVIQDCLIRQGHSGISIGSEMSGGVRNVLIQNSEFDDTDYGIRLKTMRGRGGFIENIWSRNITMHDIEKEAIRVDMTYPAYTIFPATTTIPRVRNIYFSDIQGDDIDQAIIIEGLQEQPAENIHFSNLSIHSKRGIIIDMVKQFGFKNIKITAEKDYVWKVLNGRDIQIEGGLCKQKKGACFLISGESSSNITIRDINYSGIKQKLKKENGAEENSVKF